MRDLLIVSPHFAPINAADMHRVRMSLPYFEANGWRPTVLCVDPLRVDGVVDQELLSSLPSDLRVRYASAVSLSISRRVGVGDVGTRAFMPMLVAGSRLLASGRFSLVYFSTTVFTTMALGRLWKRLHGTPFVLDIQDAWATNYYEDKPAHERPPKYWLSSRLHRLLERWTMGSVDGLVAVSTPYLDVLRNRYARLSSVPMKTIPFGVSPLDFASVASLATSGKATPQSTIVRGVYVGRGGRDMWVALRTLFRAFKAGLAAWPAVFSRVRLEFVGTSYARDERAQKTIEPIAIQEGIKDYVSERTQRIPYFEALRTLSSADFLIVPGSDDPQYTASKVYPYVLARKPILCCFQQTSSVCEFIKVTNAGDMVVLSGDPRSDSDRALTAWKELLCRLPFEPQTNWDAVRPYTSPMLTMEQCALFDEVISRRMVA